MLKGSCQCRAIEYEIDGRLGQIPCCHCSQCRKAQGSGNAVNAPVAANEFELKLGSEMLTEYESSPGKVRAFCSVCGSPIYSRLASKPEVLRIRLGTLDTPVHEGPSVHIFANSKAAWETICDGLPQYEGREPGR